MTPEQIDALRRDPPPTVGLLADRLGPAAFGALLALVGALNLVLPVPGVGQASGALALLVALQLLLGRPAPALPGRIRAIALPKDALLAATERLAPWADRLARLARPHSLGAAGRWLVPAVVLLPALLIFLPLPGSNPAAAPALLAAGAAQALACIRLALLALLAGALAAAAVGTLYGGALLGILAATA